MAAANPYDLNNLRSQDDIANAYAGWSAQNGGDTEANRATANQFLLNKGWGEGLIGKAYQQFQQAQGGASPVAPPAPAPAAPPAPAPAAAPVQGLVAGAMKPAASAPPPSPAPLPAPPSRTTLADVVGFNPIASQAEMAKSWLAANPGASDVEIAGQMRTHGVGILALAQATGLSPQEIQLRHNRATNQPDWVNGGAPHPFAAQAPGQPSAAKQAFTDQDVKNWLSQNPDMDDKGIAEAMDRFGVGIEQMASATGLSSRDVQARYLAARGPSSGAGAGGASRPGAADTSASQALVNPSNFQQTSASSWNVAPEQTVRNQVNSIIAADGPLMQQARAGAMMQANERGLINSSMAVGAGQAAVMDRAIDMGRQDASTYAQSAQFNADADNRNAMFNAGQGNQWATNQLDRDFKSTQAGLDRTFTASQSGLDRDFKGTQAGLDRAFNAGQSALDMDFQGTQAALERAAKIDAYQFDAQTRKELAGIESKYQTQLKNDGALDAQYGMYVDAIFKIDSNKDLDGPAKTALKRQQAMAFESFAKIRGLNLDLDFSGQYAADPAQANQAGAAKESGFTELSDWDRGGSDGG